MAKKKEINNQQDVSIPEEMNSDVMPDVTITETSTTVEPATMRSREWMQKKYADEEWVDDAIYDERLTQHLEDSDARLAEYAESDAIISDIIDRNPEFAMVMDAMRRGMSFRVALSRYLGDIVGGAEEGDPDWDELKKASDEFLAEKKKAEDEIATRNSNLDKSNALLTEFVERMFPTEQEQVDFVEYLRSTLSNIGMGDFSEAFFDMVYKAYMHDADVEDAKETGAIEARNEKITAKRIKAEAETDGMPMGGSASPIVEEETEPEYEDSVDEVLARRRKSIF